MNSTSRDGAATRHSIAGAASSIFGTCARIRSGPRLFNRWEARPIRTLRNDSPLLRGSRRVHPASCLALKRILDVTVAPDDDAEVRRLTITNRSLRTRPLEFTSYLELALAPHRTDSSHPAFRQNVRGNRVSGKWSAVWLGGACAGRKILPSGQRMSWPEQPAQSSLKPTAPGFWDGPTTPRSPDALRRKLSGYCGRGARSDLQFAMPCHAGSSPADRAHLRHPGRGLARGSLDADREVPASGIGSAGVRAGMDARAAPVPLSGHRAGCRAPFPGTRQSLALPQRPDAPAGGSGCAQPAGAIGVVGIRNLRRSSDAHGHGRRCSSPAAGSRTAYGTDLLAVARLPGGPDRSESGGRQLRSALAATTAAPDRSALLRDRHEPAGRRVSAGLAEYSGGSPRSVPERLQRGAERQSRVLAATTGQRRREPCAAGVRPIGRPAGSPLPALTVSRTALLQRPGRIYAGRPGIRHLSEARRHHARALVERHGQPRLRRHGQRERTGMHLERQQPDEPADSLA